MADNRPSRWVNTTVLAQGSNISSLLPAILFFVTFMFGVVVNILFIWVLGFKLKRVVNTIWFFHLIVANSIFIALTPFLGVSFLMDSHWIFGVFLCKVVNALISLCMFISVSLLTAISIDRYLLISRPLWYRSRRNARSASIISGCAWILSFVLCAPYLVFRETRTNERNKTICFNNYALSADLDNPEIQKLRDVVNWSMFIMRALLGFLLPFLAITFCYLKIAITLKRKNLTKSRKPFKVILAAILSFFICWTPYHLYSGLSIHKGHFSEDSLQTVQALSATLICINSCFTPILYLCVGGNFKQVFQKSIINLFESAFIEHFNSSEHNEERLDHSSHCVKDSLSFQQIVD
ncbi:probable G-protein coupled receptor 33 [Ambystoma mexicanum]|uniref:probable G-protein coupled receptor 33 n=1 Tax=Ambystoma mexicanum TaxID=8296 RepID=UPI0037E8C338